MPTYYAVADERYQPIGVALYRDRDEIREAVIACEWAPPDDDDAIDAAVDSIIGAAVEIEADDNIGNGYFGSWSDIPTEQSTFCDPFVFRDADGIHVGDKDNHEIFDTRAAARSYAERALLDEAKLNIAAKAWFLRASDNWAAEYQWHRDARWQLSELDQLPD